MHYEHKECKILRNYRKTQMWFNVSKERFEWKKKRKKKEQHETLILKWISNIEFHVDSFHSGGKTGSRKDRGQKGIYSIHFKRARLREKGSFTILVLRYTYNSIRKHASQVWRFYDASFVSQVCTVRGNLRVAAMKITRYNWNWLCLDL